MSQTTVPNSSANPTPTQFLSEAECAALAKRIAGWRRGGGESQFTVASNWQANVRFARNQLRTSGDVRNNTVSVKRDIEGAISGITCNQIDDVSLRALVRQCERNLQFYVETGDIRFRDHTVQAGELEQTNFDSLLSSRNLGAKASGQFVTTNRPEPLLRPTLFFDSTYAQDAARRAATVDPLITSAKRANMLAAGYIQVSATGEAVMDTWGHQLYYPRTEAQYTITVRDPEGTGSGWAGVNWNDWNRIDGPRMSDIALDKCLRSRNPVRVEPGRYTVILEPQAVHDLFFPVIATLDRVTAEGTPGDARSTGQGVFARGNKTARLGERLFDERITISQDPMDPDCGSMPFDREGNAIYAATWIEKGVVKELPYYRNYAIQVLGKNTGLPSSLTYRMNGATDTIDEMIATTKRGILVTHFSNLKVLDVTTLMMTGYTRDGTWLIENGKIKHPVKNLKFTDSPMFVFNKVEQVGVPQRVYSLSWSICPGAVVPPVKTRDFNFTALTDAV